MSIVKELRKGGGETYDMIAAIEVTAERIGSEEEILQAIINVESGEDAFDGDGCLIVPPEKHIFHRHLPKSLMSKASMLL